MNLLVIASLIASIVVKANWDDATFPIEAIAFAHGFRIEDHYVKTADGYTLKVHRIVGEGSPMYF
jgi:hypothetical protein